MIKIEVNVEEETGHLRRAEDLLLPLEVSWWLNHSKDVRRGGG